MSWVWLLVSFVSGWLFRTQVDRLCDANGQVGRDSKGRFRRKGE